MIINLQSVFGVLKSKEKNSTQIIAEDADKHRLKK